MEDLSGMQAHHHEQHLRKELSMVCEFATGGLPRGWTSILCLRQRLDLETESLPVGEVYG